MSTHKSEDGVLKTRPDLSQPSAGGGKVLPCVKGNCRLGGVRWSRCHVLIVFGRCLMDRAQAQHPSVTSRDLMITQCKHNRR